MTSVLVHRRRIQRQLWAGGLGRAHHAGFEREQIQVHRQRNLYGEGIGFTGFFGAQKPDLRLDEQRMLVQAFKAARQRRFDFDHAGSAMAYAAGISQLCAYGDGDV